MSLLKIRTFPDAVLRRVSKPVDAIDSETKRFIERLTKTMSAQPGGIGIAAPQVGVLRRIAIVDVSRKIPGTKKLILINPEIIETWESQVFREGCMSLADYTANVRRAHKIHVSWQGMDLKKHALVTSGLEAICIQHEIDHLNGLLFVDRVSSLKTDVFRRKRYL